MSELLRCSALSRSFGSLKALDNINLKIEAGKIVGLLGPNGAGKTTLLKMMNGLLQPDSGEIRICEMKPGVETKKIVSYLPDKMYFADWMRVRDIKELFADFYTDFDKSKSTEMCRVLGLDDGQLIRTLSKGTKEKMQLMLVMSRNARLYLLDEPIGGVDPATRDFILKTIITNYAENSSVLISTHLISDVEQVLDEVVFLQDGRITLQDTVDNIREKNGESVDSLFRTMFKFENKTGGEE
ncbi:MAG: ABC transporter ATP-binding protein [Lachnospiraceae bacterium]|nr:ABC transporter ATP-binding protein [Lachnospiraceae bacterium]